MRKTGMGILAAAAVLGMGCAGEWNTGGNMGGANRNGRAPGNIPGGISVRAGDVAVAPRGDWFVTLKGNHVMLGNVNQRHVEEAQGVDKPDLLAFWTQGDGFVGLYKERSGLVGNETGHETLVSYDRANKKEVWRKEFDRKDTRLDITQDRVLLAAQDLVFLDAATGNTVATYPSATGIRDVDIIHSGSHVLVTQNTQWAGQDPVTTLSVVRTSDGQPESTTTTKNCADDVNVSGDETTAYLAPTLCAKDPVTVLSLSGNTIAVKQQLPGFGPVATSPDGKTVVAFLDRDAQEPNGTTVPSDVKNSHDRYHLMFIDTATLAFTTKAVGDELPRFAFTPDGQKLLVDTPVALMSGIQVLDMATHALHNVRGPLVKLNMFTITPDSSRVFVAASQLFYLDVNGARLHLADLSVPPTGLNLSVDGSTLLMTQVTNHMLVFLDAVRTHELGRVLF